jgi:hypothetical protein
MSIPTPADAIIIDSSNQPSEANEDSVEDAMDKAFGFGSSITPVNVLTYRVEKHIKNIPPTRIVKKTGGSRSTRAASVPIEPTRVSLFRGIDENRPHFARYSITVNGDNPGVNAAIVHKDALHADDTEHLKIVADSKLSNIHHKASNHALLPKKPSDHCVVVWPTSIGTTEPATDGHSGDLTEYTVEISIELVPIRSVPREIRDEFRYPLKWFDRHRNLLFTSLWTVPILAVIFLFAYITGLGAAYDGAIINTIIITLSQMMLAGFCAEAMTRARNEDVKFNNTHSSRLVKDDDLHYDPYYFLEPVRDDLRVSP